MPGLASFRRSAELRANQNTHGAPHTLDDIYSVLRILRPGHDWCKINALELAIEAEILRVSKRLRRHLLKHRRAGRRIVYISDMYHSADWLQAQLVRLDVWQDGDVLLVSSERNACKRDGSLFLKAKEILGQNCWVHYGDNIWSDVLRAHESGLIPKWVPHSYLYVLKMFLRKRLRIPPAKG